MIDATSVLFLVSIFAFGFFCYLTGIFVGMRIERKSPDSWAEMERASSGTLTSSFEQRGD